MEVLELGALMVRTFLIHGGYTEFVGNYESTFRKEKGHRSYNLSSSVARNLTMHFHFFIFILNDSCCHNTN